MAETLAIQDVKVTDKSDRADVARKAVNLYREYKTHRQRMWERIATKCEKFYYGDQWSLEDKRVLADQNRAPSVFNNILPVVDLIVGYQISNAVNLVAKPVDRFGDVILADILTTVMKNIEWLNNMGLERKFQFLDGLITGVGIREFWIEPDSDLQPVVRGEQGSPWHYYLDPCAEKYDYRDARAIVKETWMTVEDIRLTYGEKIAKQISFPDDLRAKIPDMPIRDVPLQWSSGKDDYGNMLMHDYDEFSGSAKSRGLDIKDNKVRVLEVFEKKFERTEVFYDTTEQKAKTMDELSDIEQELVKEYALPMTTGYVTLTTIIAEDVVAQVRDIRSKKKLGNVEFYNLFNFYFPYWINGKYWGIVENLLYPNEDINKHYSQIIHILNSYANSGIWYEEGAFAPEVEADLENKLAMTGSATKLQEGGLTKIQDKARHEAPQTLFTLTGLKQELMKYISGAQDAIQGLSKRAQSGKAKESEVSQSAMKLSGIVDNFRESQRLEGKAYIWWIQNFYTSERLVRVLGEEYGQEMQDVELNMSKFGQILNDVTIGKYDITLDFEGKTQSERDRIKWMLVELSNTVPLYADIIAKYVLMYSDIPQKDQILGEFEQRQQMIQQQQMMAMGGGGAPPPMGAGGGARGGIQSAPRPSRGPRREPTRMAG